MTCYLTRHLPHSHPVFLDGVPHHNPRHIEPLRHKLHLQVGSVCSVNRVASQHLLPWDGRAITNTHPRLPCLSCLLHMLRT